MEFKRNYHSHTARCGHAVGRDEESIENAVKAGLEVYGISDHVPYPVPNDAERMRMEQAEEYLEAVEGYREKYKDRIRIYLGMEIENFPSQRETLTAFRKRLDYCILGQHNLERDVESCY